MLAIVLLALPGAHAAAPTCAQQFGALATARTPGDAPAPAALSGLPLHGIRRAAIRRAAPGYYLVPAGRCGTRGAGRLCLLATGQGAKAHACGSAPGDVATLGMLGLLPFGAAPDGIAKVTLTFFHFPPETVPVTRNVWHGSAPTEPPCGIDWLSAAGTLQRSVTTCNTDAGDDD